MPGITHNKFVMKQLYGIKLKADLSANNVTGEQDNSHLYTSKHLIYIKHALIYAAVATGYSYPRS